MKKIMHLSDLNRSQTFPAAFQRSSMVRGFKRLMWALNFEKASSIGLNNTKRPDVAP